MSANARDLIAKIEQLPANRIAEVEDFVDFLRTRDQDGTLTQAAAAVSATSFAAIWDNSDDAAYG
jgi:hypothetical protein